MLNKVILIGRLGKDPEMRQTQQGAPRCTISLATDETWKDKITGEKQNKVEWHRVIFFNRIAEIAAQYLRKGSLIYVEGKINSYRYTGQDGIERTMVEIYANEMKMLSPKTQQDPYGTQAYGAPGGYAQQPYGANAPYGNHNYNAAPPPSYNQTHNNYGARPMNNYSPNSYPNDTASDLSSPAVATATQRSVAPPTEAPKPDALLDDDVPF